MMLLSRDDILGVYDSPGRETLELLSSAFESALAPAKGDRSSRARKSAGDDENEEKEKRSPDASKESAARRAIAKRLRHATQHDSLTGLCNRQHFQDLFKRALARARDAGSGLAFLLMDLDNFKDVNNTLGHQAGDAILIETGETIQTLLSADDTLGRFGGDEFALLIPNVSSAECISSIIQRLLSVVGASVPRLSPNLRSSASLGVSLFPDHGSEVSELIQNAELALYRAKANGRGRAEVYAPHMRAAFTQRLDQMSAFRTLLEAGSVRPYYQPQVRLTDRRSHGFEALARWILPNGDILFPKDFQAALEDPDAAILLGEHMLQSVSDDLCRWREGGMPPCKVSVNVTAPELNRGDYPEKVAAVLAAKGIPPSQLTIEITETVLLDENVTQLAKTLNDLHKLGVSIALDDFGTGFATLTHLRTHPIDQIKIDRSFIAELTSNDDDNAIVRAMLSLARSLGIETVAEGLETEAQLRCLQMLGCEYAQGFYFSRAVTADEAEAYFRAHRAYRRATFAQFRLAVA
ncbi:putative bifunctional diguanylate cyclase/phosphodiesterase [Microvirga flavescens]|uniref:putative bifunctional diguanylate cyclase/phosphodiesterase n=1 Tax=Microvirga flavescens TaxID=2249811 RepID=UPI0018E075CA|nr:EAL domain-containing protein [Microvirga flavescens]